MNPMINDALLTLFRWAFTLLAGWFINHGILTGNQAETYVAGAAVGAVTLTWALWAKYRGRLKFLTALQMPADSTEHEVEQRIADKWVPNPSITTPKNTVP